MLIGADLSISADEMSTQVKTIRRKGRGVAPMGTKPRVKPLRLVMLEVLNADNQAGLVRGLTKIYRCAAAGSMDAMAFIFDRVDGKPRQAVEMSGEDGGPVVVADVRSLLDGSVDELMARIRASDTG